jgi:hypothetical protein
MSGRHLFRASFLSAALLAASPHASSLEFSDIAQEGQLRFLTVHPEPNTYRYESRVRITEDSLVSGVVSLVTCHYQLDPIRKVVILFNPNRLQTIEVREASGIGGLEVEGHRVIMSDVKRGAMVCIDLQSKALDRIDDTTYRLQAGPLMRRYFDGYLPMQAKLSFEWPGHRVSLKQTNPEPQPGVKLMQDSDRAELDIIFAGRLLANIDLQVR